MQKLIEVAYSGIFANRCTAGMLASLLSALVNVCGALYARHTTPAVTSFSGHCPGDRRALFTFLATPEPLIKVELLANVTRAGEGVRRAATHV